MAIKYTFWAGETLSQPGGFLVFDTETEVIYQKDEHGHPRYQPGRRLKDPKTGKLLRNPDGTPATWPPTLVAQPLTEYSPRLALLTAYDGRQPPVIVRPHQLRCFLRTHPGRHWIGHNVAFDFWSVADALPSTPYGDDREEWFALLEQGSFHDTMLLDKLVLLARGEVPARGEKFYGRNLARLAAAYEVPGEPDKESPYRLRFGELIDLDDAAFQAADPGFFDYATTDAVATWQIWQKLYPQARVLAQQLAVPKSYPDALVKWGVLTETLQVQAAVALLRVSRYGLALDRERAADLEACLRRTHAQALRYFEENYPELLRHYAAAGKRQGALKVAAKSGLPQMQTRRLRQILTDIAREKGFTPPSTTGKLALKARYEGKTPPVSASVKAWKDYAGVDPFIDHWLSLAPLSKLLGFFAELKKRTGPDGRIHCQYNTLLKTGRVAAWAPNLQQIPRDARFRDLFVAAPGHVLLTADFKFLELRTLAACCELWLGRSRLGTIIRQGVDPHEFTAALMNQMTVAEFRALKKTDPIKYKNDRQNAKAINFGYPGGLGADKFVAYARAQYGVTLTREQAQAFKAKLITEIYPELNDSHGYLADTTVADLARNLGVTQDWLVEFLWPRLKNVRFDLYRLGQIVRGDPVYPSGEAYPHADVKKLWAVLEELLAQPAVRVAAELRRQVAQRQPSYQQLYQPLFRSLAVTPTGRVRAGVGYTDGRNTPFQGLAADGAKRALWRLIAAGYRVVVFVHDEVVVELPAATAAQEAPRVLQMLCQAMEEVLGGVPAEVEGGLAPTWRKT